MGAGAAGEREHNNLPQEVAHEHEVNACVSAPAGSKHLVMATT